MHGPRREGNVRSVTIDPTLTASFGSDQTISLLRHGYRFWEVLREREGALAEAQELVHRVARPLSERGGRHRAHGHGRGGAHERPAAQVELLGRDLALGDLEQAVEGRHGLSS